MVLRSGNTEVVILAGQIGTGKTSVAEELRRSSGAEILRVRDALQVVIGSELCWSRERLQAEGAALEEMTGGRWLLDVVGEQKCCDRLVVDSGRTIRQVEPLLQELGARLVYLRATEATRRARYERAAGSDRVKAGLGFEHAMRHTTERKVSELAGVAGLVIDTDDLPVGLIAGRVRMWLSWTAPKGFGLDERTC